MSDEDVAWAIAALESEFEWQHADFRRRFQRLQQSHAIMLGVVAALLCAAVLLLAFGLGAGSIALWGMGLGAVAVSAVVNQCYRWHMRRAR